MSEETFLPIIIKKLLNNQTVEVFGNGSRRQNFINIKDIYRYFEKAVEIKKNGVYNLGTENPMTNLELIEYCRELIGSNSKIEFSEKKDIFDNYNWEVSIQKSINTFGIKPKFDLKHSVLELSSCYSKVKKL